MVVQQSLPDDHIVSMLVCNLHHAVTNDGIFVGVALLELHCHNILAEILILHMHHCVVEVRVERFSDCLDRLNAHIIECLYKLLIYLFHSICKRGSFRVFRNGIKTSFKVIDDRKDLFDYILRTDLIHCGLFLVRSLAVVIKLRHGSLELVI